jgi:hypothetical protein
VKDTWRMPGFHTIVSLVSPSPRMTFITPQNPDSCKKSC